MVKNILRWPELTESDLRRQMKNAEESHINTDNDINDDLNGLTVWEDAFLRGTKLTDGGSNEA